MKIIYGVLKLRLICPNILLMIFMISQFGYGSDRLISLADSLRSAGFYDKAITEYKRFLYFSPESDKCGEINARIGYCMAESGRWDKALSAMDKAIEYSMGDSLAEQCRMDRAVLLMAGGNNIEARDELWQIIYFSENKTSVYHANQLLVLSAVLTYEWNTALKLIDENVTEQNIYLDSLKAALQDADEDHYRSAYTARVLSTFIPGLGQVYSGCRLNGLNALILDGALAYLTIDCLLEENYTGGILSFIFLFKRYYEGNIRQAGQSALDYNLKKNIKHQKAVLKFLDRLNQPIK